MGDNIIETAVDLAGTLIEGIADGIESAGVVEELWTAFRKFRSAKRRAITNKGASVDDNLDSDPLAPVLAIVERHAGRQAAEELRQRIAAQHLRATDTHPSDLEVDEFIRRAQANAQRSDQYANFVTALPALAPQTGRARHRAPHPSDGYTSEAA
jgi:hypothetical protein